MGGIIMLKNKKPEEEEEIVENVAGELVEWQLLGYLF